MIGKIQDAEQGLEQIRKQKVRMKRKISEAVKDKCKLKKIEENLDKVNKKMKAKHLKKCEIKYEFLLKKYGEEEEETEVEKEAKVILPDLRCFKKKKEDGKDPDSMKNSSEKYSDKIAHQSSGTVSDEI